MKAKTKFTKLWSILLALAMVVGMLPIAALAAGSATATADFSADPNTALALLNAAKTGTENSTWDGDTKTLTLNGVNFTTTAATAVKLPEDATIVLAEGTTNTIKGGNSDTRDCYGIQALGELTIQGTGTLEVTGGTASDTNDNSYGIRASGVSISGGEVEVTGGAVSGDGSASYGIYAITSVTISGGEVEATGGTASGTSGHSFGIRASGMTISGTADVTANGGTASGTDSLSYGIYSDGVTISGGSLIAQGTTGSTVGAINKAPSLPGAYQWRISATGTYTKNTETGYSWAPSQTYVEITTAATATADFTGNETKQNEALALLNAAKTGTENSTWNSDTNTLTLNGVNFETTTAATAVKLPDGAKIVLNGENTIKGGDSSSSSEECYGIYVEGGLTIQGTGQLNVTAGDAANCSSYGISAYAVTISGGTVTANGGNTDTDDDSYGIYVYNNNYNEAKGNVTITGGTVTATGGDTYDDSFGIYAYSNVTISGGTVTANGGNAYDDNCGIYVNNGNVTISGGTVTATGGTANANKNGSSYGIRANAVTISGGIVTATGGKAPNSYGTSCGIYGGVNIYGGIVTATGGNAQRESYGIFPSYGSVYISGGTVIAEAGSVGDGGTAAALSKQPTLSITGYSWRTSDSVSYFEFPGKAYDGSAGTYLEIKSNPTITFNANGGTVTTDTATTNAAGKLTSLPTPTRSGYTFNGWNTKQNGTGTTVTSETTFTENTTVYAQWEVATVSITSVAITGIDAPKSNKALDTEADCNTTGVSNAKPTVTWDSSDSKAGYGKIYTASITLTASEGYVFADSTTVTVNGNPATSVTKNANGTLKVTYTFPATDKHNIEITVDTDVRDGDAAKNPTISSGYEIEFCFFVEDTDKDGVFINKTGNSITLDDKTLVVDKALVEAFAAQSGGRYTYESLMADLKDEFDLDELKTEFTGGYDYSVLAYICHSDNAYFDCDDNKIVTNAIVKVNGKKITDNCLGFGGGMEIMPVAYVFSAAKTYTVSFDANGGSGTMADVTGVLGDYTLPENGFTAPEGKQFKAWSVDGNEKAVGDKITVTADTTVKAVWETLPAAPPQIMTF